MKAFVFTKYGMPKDLVLTTLDKPIPKEREILVKIHTSAVNDYDWCVIRGKPYLYRIFFGLRKPKQHIPGMELSGTVEALGEQASAFKVGDAVYGDISDYRLGSFAEYLCVDERALTLKPKSMSFEVAAAISHASLLAYQGMVELGDLAGRAAKTAGTLSILINGAGGGVGCYGVQLAKLYGAKVTGVDSGIKLESMRALGFDSVIDYTKEDFTKTKQKYDLILDARTTRSTFKYLRVLQRNGIYVSIGGKPWWMIALLLFKPWVALCSKKRVSVLGHKANKGLDYISTLYIEGKLQTVIDGPYKFSETPQVIQRFGNAKHIGKIVVTIADD